jgi:hypothetical protein
MPTRLIVLGKGKRIKLSVINLRGINRHEVRTPKELVQNLGTSVAESHGLKFFFQCANIDTLTNVCSR